MTRSARWRCVLGACCLVVAAVSLNPCCMAAADEPAADEAAAGEARWYGELDAADRRFRFVLEETTATSEAEGDAEADAESQPSVRWLLRSIDEGDRRFPLEGFVNDGERLRFELPISRASYTGNVLDNGTVEGTWEQRGTTLALAFRPVSDEPLPPPAEEIWTGTLNAIVQKLDLRFRITRDAAGLRTVWMDSLSQAAGGFRGDLAIKRGDDGEDVWSFDVPAVRGRFEGTLADDGDGLEGTWTQSGVSLPLTLTRSEDRQLPPPSAKNRPQTPQPPFPYVSEEVTFHNTAADVTLAGTLTVPEGDGPFPAVVLISGSGPQDRDETLFDHKPFAVWADQLTRRGVAVLRYDDRGVGGSSEGSPDATSEDLSVDVEVARDFLAGLPQIDPERIGLVGHSEGAMLATMAASRKPGVACVVMLAGAGVDGEQVLLSQGRRVLEAEGVNEPDQLQRQRILQEVLMGAVLDAPPGASQETMAAEAARRLRDQLPDDLSQDQDLDALAEAGVARLASPWFRFFLEYDPAEAIRKLKCPVLALVGSNDVQVDAATNLPPLREAVAEAGHPDSAVEELSGLNHLFQTATTGAVSEYDTIEETISPAVLERVGDWLTARLAVGPQE